MIWADKISFLNSDFPDITIVNSKQTSPETKDYNCIAWAYGRDDVWCQPDATGRYFWPVSRCDCSIAALEDLFSSIGYSRSTDASIENGFLKIALYVNEEGLPTHAARQLTTGKWTSKLEKEIDIEHDSPEVLNGPAYGIAKVFMKRKI